LALLGLHRFRRRDLYGFSFLNIGGVMKSLIVLSQNNYVSSSPRTGPRVMRGITALMPLVSRRPPRRSPYAGLRQHGQRLEIRASLGLLG